MYISRYLDIKNRLSDTYAQVHTLTLTHTYSYYMCVCVRMRAYVRIFTRKPEFLIKWLFLAGHVSRQQSSSCQNLSEPRSSVPPKGSHSEAK